jgi:hypothetical protein
MVRGKATWLPVTSLLVKHAHGITSGHVTSGSSSSLLRKCGCVLPHILLATPHHNVWKIEIFFCGLDAH